MAWTSTPWVHSCIPNLALIGDGVGMRGPRSSKFGHVCGIMSTRGNTSHTEEVEIWHRKICENLKISGSVVRLW